MKILITYFFLLSTAIAQTLTAPVLIYPTYNAGYISPLPFFDWNDVSGATKYQVQISKDGFSRHIFEKTVNVSSYKLTSGMDTIRYWWRVRALDDAGNVSDFSPIFNFVVGKPNNLSSPDPPQLIYPRNNMTEIQDLPEFDWSDVSGATAYKLQVSIDNFQNVAYERITSHSNHLLNAKMVSNRLHWWRVQTLVGDIVIPWSAIYTFRTGGTMVQAEDINSDAIVNGDDMTLFFNSPSSRRDLNGDGVMDVFDILVIYNLIQTQLK